MKKILMITSLYPSDGIKILNNTAVCHYFTKEWKNLGYIVRVIFCYHSYPSYYYPMLRLFDKMLANKSGVAVMCSNIKDDFDYYLDKIKVTRIPIKKNRPGGFFLQKEIERVAQEVKNILNNEEYVPDLIVGHFLHPAIDIISNLKISFPSAKTAVAIHGKEERYENNTQELLKNIDYIGYRSYPIKDVFESYYGFHKYFMCPSGVPENYIIPQPRKFENVAKRFIYVGSFMKRKYPSTLVPAIAHTYGDDDFRITYVGDGNGKSLITKETKIADCVNKVFFTGRLNRDEVKNQLDQADVFIMISQLETFGLVYLEAMARGCIVVASKDEGMEGIIQHGINGFLCKAGDVSELTSIIEIIKGMSPEELNSMSEAGRQTSISMTDKIVAKQYIESIL